MKYALESLPELIAEQDYLDLCVALGIEQREWPVAGARLSDIVRGRVLKADREAMRRIRQGERFFDTSAHLGPQRQTGVADIKRVYDEVVADMDDHQSASVVV